MPRGKQGIKVGRRELDRTFQQSLRDRKRLRQRRREEHELRADHAQPDTVTVARTGDVLAVTATHTFGSEFAPPFRAPDVKDGLRRWRIVDANGFVAGYATSRDKARTKAREMNEASA